MALRKKEVKAEDSLTIEFNGRVFKYDFDSLEIEQVELARELGEFKHNQLQQTPEQFEDVINSGGAVWFPLLMAILLKEEKEGNLLPFDLAKARNDIEPLIRKLPIRYYKQLRSIAESFFQVTGQSETGSLILHGKRKFDIKTEFLKLIMATNRDGSVKNILSGV